MSRAHGRSAEVRKQYVFIVGCGGTGSGLLRNVFNLNPHVNIATEMHLMTPKWVRKDFVTHAEEIGPLEDDGNVRKLMDLMYSGSIDARFWTAEPGIKNLPAERVLERILESDRSYRSIVSILLEEEALLNGSSVTGAKLPVNIVCLPKLMDWFPDSRYIHAVRDPRAIHTSRVKKDHIEDRVAPNWKLDLKRIPYTVQQYKAVAAFHKRCSGKPNYFFVRFEDILTEPDRWVREMCDFVGVECADEMLNPKVDSTGYVHGKDRGFGFSKGPLSRWKSDLTPVARATIQTALFREMKMFGYSRSG